MADPTPFPVSSAVVALMQAADVPEMQDALGINLAPQALTGGGPYDLTLTPFRPSEYTVTINANVSFTGTPDADELRSSARVEAVVSGGPWTITHPLAYRNGSITQTTTVLVPDGTHYFNLITKDGGATWEWEDSVTLLSDMPPGALDVSPFVKAVKALGGTLKADALYSQFTANTSVNLTSGQIRGGAVWLDKDDSINGVAVNLRGSGSYTPDTFNGVALYSYATGVFTRIAISSGTDPWQPGAAGWVKVPFTAPTATLPAGVYFAAILYRSTAQTTAPAVSGFTAGNSSQFTVIGASAAIPLAWSVSGQTTMPSTLTFPGDVSVGDPRWMALY